jgi:hypothetical protein
MSTPAPRQFGKITVEAPLEIVPSAHGYHIRDSQKRSLWARITGSCGSAGSGSVSGVGSCPSCAYEWIEVAEAGSECATEDLVNRGTVDDFPAYEMNGDSTIAVGTIVRLHPSRVGPWYTFTPGGSTPGTGFEFAVVLDDSPEDRVELDNIYYNAAVPQWNSGTQTWDDPEEGDLIWLVTRVEMPLAKGDIIPCRLVQSSYDPTDGEDDARPVYAGIKSRLTDPLVVQSDTAVSANGNLYWPARTQYWDNGTQERKMGRQVWVIDWLDDPKAFRGGDHILAHWIGSANPGAWDDQFTGDSGSFTGSGSGSEPDDVRPLYMTFCSGINTRFLKCFDNNVLARNGTIANVGGRISFLDEECLEATDFSGICLEE